MSATNSHSTNEPTWDQLDAIVKQHKLDTLSTMDTAALIWRLSEIRESGASTPVPSLATLRDAAVKICDDAAQRLAELSNSERDGGNVEASNLRNAQSSVASQLGNQISRLEVPAALSPQAPLSDPLAYKLREWTRQISEQPPSRVAPGIASAAKRLHDELCLEATAPRSHSATSSDFRGRITTNTTNAAPQAASTLANVEVPESDPAAKVSGESAVAAPPTATATRKE